jgi:hypothetical protein
MANFCKYPRSVKGVRISYQMELNIYIRKEWDEENIIFYIHFQNDEAIRQIEISPKSKTFLTLENPTKGESMLLDQSLEFLELDKKEFITEQEFNAIWDERDDTLY